MGSGKKNRVQKGPSAKLSYVPKRPGVYLFKGTGEKVIYVGKGKDLRARLGSYFRKSAALDNRKASMVGRVRDFSWIVTESELEALALEANLIKQYRPRFNVILRDDKNYPYLRLSLKEKWPRLEVVRKVKRDGARYFGPYVPAGGMWEAISFIRRNFRIRSCGYSLEKPMRPCIQHQMGRCSAPCAGLITRERYMEAVKEVEMFLMGRNTELLDGLRRKMQEASDSMRYEEAAVLRDRIAALEGAFESQRVVSPELGDMDVVGLHAGGGEAALQVLFVKSGVMTGAKDFYLRGLEDMPTGELMHGFLETFYAKDTLPPAEVLVSARPDDAENMAAWLSGRRGARVRISVPRERKRVELLKMACENAQLMFESRKGSAGLDALKEIQERFSLRAVPLSIGAFDVSNISGAEPVGAFVCWSGGEFQKDLYRRVKIRTVEGIDDYAMMRETVKRVLGGLDDLPDLVVIDGGRGHLEAGVRALGELEIKQPPMMISVAKGPDRVFVPGSEEGFAIGDRSAAALLLRRIRDEAHRFAISLHKKLRGRKMLESPLLDVQGIGKKRRLELLRHFGSIEAIRSAGEEELASVPGMNRRAARAVMEALGGGIEQG